MTLLLRHFLFCSVDAGLAADGRRTGYVKGYVKRKGSENPKGVAKFSEVISEDADGSNASLIAEETDCVAVLAKLLLLSDP